MCYPSRHVAIMSIFVLCFYSNLQTVTAIAVFCANIDASRVNKEAVK
jgi:membrane-associated phospholipid phosphatase